MYEAVDVFCLAIVLLLLSLNNRNDYERVHPLYQLSDIGANLSYRKHLSFVAEHERLISVCNKKLPPWQERKNGAGNLLLVYDVENGIDEGLSLFGYALRIVDDVCGILKNIVSSQENSIVTGISCNIALREKRQIQVLVLIPGVGVQGPPRAPKKKP